MGPAPGPQYSQQQQQAWIAQQQQLQQQQQQAWMAQQQQHAARSGWAGALPQHSAAAASPFYELSGAAGVAQLHARLAAGAASTAAAEAADDHDDLDLPTALPHELASSHEDVAVSRQHYVAGWAQGASAEAAAAAAAEAEALQAAEADMFVGGSLAESHASAVATSVSQSADSDAPRKQAGQQQQQRPPQQQQQQQQMGAGLQRFGSREGAAPVAVTPAEAPVVVTGFVVQQRDEAAQQQE
jgi:hypothetical protein